VSVDATALVDAPAASVGRRWGRSETLRSLRRDKAAMLGLAFIAVLVFAAVFAPLVAPASPSEVVVLDRLKPPAWVTGGSAEHLLGTDALGRDVLSRLIYGARMTLSIALAVMVLAGTFGVIMGLIAGYKGGRWDTIIMRAADAQLAFPGLLLVLLVLGFIGPSIAAIIGVVALYGWMIYARLVRGMVLQLRETPAVQAAALIGCSTPRILFRHLLPVLYSALMTQAMLELARVVLVEASLSYLGLGVQPPDASWGLMVAENQQYIQTAWWTVLFPGLALVFTVLSINLVANWLRVQTDPQQRQRRFAGAALKRQRGGGFSVGRRRGHVDAPELARPRGEAPLLAVDQLEVRFHSVDGEVVAVRDVSLDIKPGETLGIVGESGSGKSTAALALMDLVPPPGRIESARLRWQGEEIGQERVHALRGREITMIFQDPMTSLNPLVTVGRQVSEVLVKHKGMTKAQARERTAEIFSLVGIPSPRERLDQYPHELSGGLRQRIMIAAALAPEPKLVIADEPTTALDATIQAQILELIADLQQRLHVAMMLITHDLGVIARVCDRVVVMYGGRVVEEAPIEGLFATPRHRYTEALLGAVPRVERAQARLATIPGRPPARNDDIQGCLFSPRCGYATDQCRQMPALVADGPGRRFACWHPRDDAR
jgi:peptide/nickel transport system permease protein